MNAGKKKFFAFLKPILFFLVLGILIGHTLGLFWGWEVDPVIWYDTPIDSLRSDLKADYLRMSVESYLYKPDKRLAWDRWVSIGDDRNEVLLNLGKDISEYDLDQFLTAITSMELRDNIPVMSGGSIEDRNTLYFNYILVGVLFIVGTWLGVGAVRVLAGVDPVYIKNQFIYYDSNSPDGTWRDHLDFMTPGGIVTAGVKTHEGNKDMFMVWLHNPRIRKTCAAIFYRQKKIEKDTTKPLSRLYGKNSVLPLEDGAFVALKIRRHKLICRSGFVRFGEHDPENLVFALEVIQNA